MAVSIKSLNLNVEETKHLSVTGHLISLTQLLPLYFLRQVFLSPAVDLRLPSAEARWQQVKSQGSLPLPPQAASPEILPDKRQFFKGKPPPKGGPVTCYSSTLFISVASDPWQVCTL